MHDEFTHLRQFSSRRVNTRTLDELVGITRGLAADGQIVQAEAEFLQHWLKQTEEAQADPVYKILHDRLEDMLEDGHLDNDEATELLEMIHALTGDDGKLKNYRSPTRLPLDTPMPTLDFEGKNYLMTGVMAFGPRKECERLITERGGICKTGMSKRVNYLVIGTIASEHWMHSSHGRKIQTALNLRKEGHPIAIVDEEHFLDHALSKTKR